MLSKLMWFIPHYEEDFFLKVNINGMEMMTNLEAFLTMDHSKILGVLRVSYFTWFGWKTNMVAKGFMPWSSVEAGFDFEMGEMKGMSDD